MNDQGYSESDDRVKLRTFYEKLLSALKEGDVDMVIIVLEYAISEINLREQDPP